MKRVETSDATTSLGAEGVGPAGAATPPEPGVTWSVVLGVSEGGGEEGRATSVGSGGGRRRERGKRQCGRGREKCRAEAPEKERVRGEGKELKWK